jgi:hypothetical protein
MNVLAGGESGLAGAGVLSRWTFAGETGEEQQGTPGGSYLRD